MKQICYIILTIIIILGCIGLLKIAIQQPYVTQDYYLIYPTEINDNAGSSQTSYLISKN